MRDKIELFGGRRFIMAMGAGITSTVLQWFGKLDPAGGSYVAIVISTVAAYITGNTYQKTKATTKEEAEA